jgi:hypothetical protein
VITDGVERSEQRIHLVDDRQEHSVVVEIPPGPAKIDVGK